MTFDIALSGLAAARSDLDVTGNNIANAGTNGFKESRAEFADVFASSFGGVSGNATGGGVKLAAVRQQFGQGKITATSNTLDLAVNGEGFFTVTDREGNTSYTRDGAFSVDRDGFIVNNRGQQLQVFPPLDDDGTTFNTGGLAALQIDTGIGAPAATTAVDAQLNLSASSPVLGGAATDIDPNDPSSFSYTTAVTTYDSLGAAHTATLYVRRTADLTYGSRVFVDGNDIGTQDLTFDDAGQLQTGQPVTYPTAFTPVNGAAPVNLTYDFSDSTLFGNQFSVNDLSQDGFTTGRLAGVGISADGTVSARFSNGRSVGLGRVALANFDNPQGLQQAGENTWNETFESGDVAYGEPGTSSLGAVQSGGLEASNVDLSEQLVRLITAQRTFQANSQVISTADEITQTAINIGR